MKQFSLFLLIGCLMTAAGWAQSKSDIPRMPDGKPDFTGTFQNRFRHIRALNATMHAAIAMSDRVTSGPVFHPATKTMTAGKVRFMRPHPKKAIKLRILSLLPRADGPIFIFIGRP